MNENKKQIQIKSKISDVTFFIDCTSSLSKKDKGFIAELNLKIFHNDQTCVLWAFDTRLPSGKWLENITFNNELTKANALII